MLLITSPFFNKNEMDEETIFLGPWCFDFDNVLQSNNGSTRIVPHPFLNLEEKNKADEQKAMENAKKVKAKKEKQEKEAKQVKEEASKTEK